MIFQNMLMQNRLVFAYPLDAKSIGRTKELNLARLLRPKRGCCGKNFLLELHPLSFISHPMDTSSIDVTRAAKVFYADLSRFSF